ncbi:MipA/OmpV family protein [Pseudoalteromonas fenneropenaei]|uniref:MipA/OmpV family protein n=1 Tax=Pseudoalteromonas fenneropenaei TaxID=1737459 RepID=A0ABV7CJY5_9GAMM
MNRVAMLIAAVMLQAQVMAAAPPTCEQNSPSCQAVGSWRFAVAVGAGVIDNPLYGGDDIPLLVVPSISYYGERFFIENLSAGYTFVDDAALDISFVSEFNDEATYFYRYHPRNIFFNGQAEALSAVKDDAVRLSINQIADRDWALDAGVRLHWYWRANTKLTAQWLHDISGVYQGYHATLALNQRFDALFSHDDSLTIGAGLTYKDSALTDYYYGVGYRDKVDRWYQYQAGSGVSPFMNLSYSKPINASWRFLLRAKYSRLGSHISASPLVAKDDSYAVFVAGSYAF